jgi:hypothetical protein
MIFFEIKTVLQVVCFQKKGRTFATCLNKDELYKLIRMNKLKTKSINQILCLSLLLLFSYQAKAQVTVGCLTEPQGGSLLDLKEKETPGADESNSTKGVLFPKVSLKSATSLEPLFSTTDDPQKKSSRGMIVYNVNRTANGLSEGLCVWNGTEWTAVLGGGPSEKAEFEVDCEAKITLSGRFFKGSPLSPYVNVVTLPVNVKKKGTYEVTVYSDPDNQYSFEAKGEFLKTGNHTLTLNGTGIPKESTAERSNIPDKIKIRINGSEYDVSQGCPSLILPQLTVGDLPVNYFFNCSRVDISNVKLKMAEASTDSYITIRLQVPQEAAGGMYHIETNVVGGIKFEGSGSLFPGQQTVMLKSNGAKPAMPGTYDFRFITNSTDTQTGNCSVEIPVFGRNVKIFVWGDSSGGNWDIGKDGKAVNLILKSEALFGLGENASPAYPVSGIEFSRANKIPDASEDWDILIISYNGVPDGADAQRLSTYIDNNRVVIHCLEGNYSMALPDLVFGKGAIKRNAKQTATETKILLQPGNPLTNGVYMDISDRGLGYDGGSNLGFDVTDASNVEIVGIRESDRLPAIIRHKTKPYVMLGDGGLFCGNTAPARNQSPLLVSPDGLPAINTFENYAFGAYNAHFFVNTMIWAITYRLSH